MRTFRIVICEVGSLKNSEMEKVMCVCVCVCVCVCACVRARARARMCHLKNTQMSQVSKRT